MIGNERRLSSICEQEYGLDCGLMNQEPWHWCEGRGDTNRVDLDLQPFASQGSSFNLEPILRPAKTKSPQCTPSSSSPLFPWLPWPLSTAGAQAARPLASGESLAFASGHRLATRMAAHTRLVPVQTTRPTSSAAWSVSLRTLPHNPVVPIRGAPGRRTVAWVDGYLVSLSAPVFPCFSDMSY